MSPKKTGDEPGGTTNIPGRLAPPRGSQGQEITASGAAARLNNAFAASDPDAQLAARQARRRRSSAPR